MRIVAIIAAAGEGRRMGGTIEKQFLCLQGKPVLSHTLALFDVHPMVDGLILVVSSSQRQALREKVLDPYPCRKLLKVIDGGKERQDSVARGVKALPPECELVVVHDGVRPLLNDELLTSVLESAQKHGAAVAAVPARDTVKRVKEGRVASTLERETVWLAQTPQAFKTGLLRRAYEEAARTQTTATDDAALVELLGVPVHLVLGSAQNIKVTTPMDLVVAETLIAQRDLDADSRRR